MHQLICSLDMTNPPLAQLDQVLVQSDLVELAELCLNMLCLYMAPCTAVVECSIINRPGVAGAVL